MSARRLRFQHWLKKKKKSPSFSTHTEHRSLSKVEENGNTALPSTGFFLKIPLFSAPRTAIACRLARKGSNYRYFRRNHLRPFSQFRMPCQGNRWQWVHSNFFSVASSISTSEKVRLLSRRSAAFRSHQLTNHCDSRLLWKDSGTFLVPCLFPFNSSLATSAQLSFGRSGHSPAGRPTAGPHSASPVLTSSGKARHRLCGR